jgi:hypothetical protein
MARHRQRFAACACALDFGSLPESASEFRQAACNFLQVPVGLLKLKRWGLEVPLKRQKWLVDLLVAMGAICTSIKNWFLTSVQNLMNQIQQ